MITGACAPNAGEPAPAEPVLSIDRSGDPVVARVDGSPIYQLDVRRAAEAQGLIGDTDAIEPGDPMFKTTLDDLIDQRLLALDALRSGVANDPEAQKRLAAAQDRILGNYRVERHLADIVTDEAVRDLYEAQRALAGSGEERRLRRIVVADEAKAQEILRRLTDEEDFDALIEEYSASGTLLDASGDMGWVSRNMLSGAVAAQGFSTPVGGRSAPFQVVETWQIIEVIDTRTPQSRSFSEVREDIERFMTYEAVQTLMTDLRGRADIERVSLDELMPPEPDETTPEETVEEETQPE